MLLVSFLLLFASIFLLLFVINANAQWIKLPSAEVRSYDISGFDKIVLTSPAEVTVRQSDKFSVSARSKYKGALDILKLELRDRTLYISMEQKIFQSFPEHHVFVTLPILTSLTVHGSGEIELKGAFVGESLEARIEGSGDMELEEVRLRDNFSSTLNGSGDLKFKNLAARNMQLSLHGSGDIEGAHADVFQNADFSIQGSGTLQMRTVRCANFSTKLNGSGDNNFRNVAFSENASIELSGSGDINIGKLGGGRTIATVLRGSGDINFSSVDVEIFDAELYMSGDIFVGAGQAQQVSASVNGSGDMNLQRMMCKSARVRLQGSGDIALDVREVLYMEGVHGSGEVHYTGNPTLKVKK